MIPLSTLQFRLRNGVRAFRKWVVPYAFSRVRSRQFRPLLSYLFTDWKCNIGCHYCYTYDNSREGMTLQTAIDAMKWLKTTGCRVIAIMGGEPLLRKDFIVEVVRRGTELGHFVYLPTNGVLLDRAFIHEVGAAGVAMINVAVDTMEEKPGMPKCFSRIEPQLYELLALQKRYGYMIVFNVNITPNNTEDIRSLVRIAHEHGLGMDFHINERPHVDQPHYRHEASDSYFCEENYGQADELIDWLIMRYRGGQPMINTLPHFQAMKGFIRGTHPDWVCRAGRNSCAVRIDGSLSPCFGLYSMEHDWGRVFEPRFDFEQLDGLKQHCTRRCLSTCQFNLSQYYSWAVVMGWVYKHSIMG